MIARRRFEFPHLSLRDSDDNVVGIVQLDAVLIDRNIVWRTGPCGHARWPQWWVLFRVLRIWAFVPTPDDVPRLLAHYGMAVLKTVPRGMRFERVGLLLPKGSRITVSDSDGVVIP